MALSLKATHTVRLRHVTYYLMAARPLFYRLPTANYVWQVYPPQLLVQVTKPLP